MKTSAAFFRKAFYTTLITGLALSLLLPAVAMAHRITVFAWVEGDTVQGESKFSGGRAPVNAPVTVSDTDGNELLSLTTDDQGRFSFPVPKKAALVIRVVAGQGHQGEWTVREEEITGLPAATPATAAPPPSPAASATATPGITIEQVEAVVDKAIARKLDPVIRMLADQEQARPTFKDIMGGIGWILGIAGAASLARSRRRSDAPGKNAR